VIALVIAITLSAGMISARAQYQSGTTVPQLPYGTLNPAMPSTVPQSPETPVSPTTPGTAPGTQAGPGTAIGTNPITGQPCLGGGSSAINGGMPNAPIGAAQAPVAGQGPTMGLPPATSVYGLNNELPTGLPGAC
jgi:hypothetical protein